MQKSERVRTTILLIIAELQASGASGLRQIAPGLKGRDILLPRGAVNGWRSRFSWILNPDCLLTLDAEVVVEHSRSAVCINRHMHGLVN